MSSGTMDKIKGYGGLIMAGFAGDCGGVAVSGEDTGVGRKSEKATERAEELVDITSRQVGTAIAHTEKSVTGEKDFVLGEIETDRARRVAGGGNQGER